MTHKAITDSARGQYRCYKLDFISGKSYVGITSKSIENRFNQHIRDAKRKAKNPIHHALNKYGKELVVISEIACVDDWELLCLIEQEAIIKMKTKYPNGYNVTDGGDGVLGLKHTQESKEKRRLRHSGELNHNFGKPMPDSIKLKISLTKKGVPSPAKGKPNEKIRIRNLQDENMKRMTELGKNNKGSTWAYKVKVIATHKKTGNKFRFNSQKEAAISINCVVNSISNCLSGRRKSANGYTFERCV